MTAVQDALNRSTWSQPSSRRWLDSVREFTDPGEEAALAIVRERARGKPILDLGVGTGRTIPMLAPLTHDYRAIDYLDAMVESCHERHPRVRVELGDARSLDGVPDAHFGLVNFSFNGIDAVDHDDRARVLAEMRRVVRRDGSVLFSTLNMDGPAFRERPWTPRAATNCSLPRAAARTAIALASVPLDIARWMRIRPGAQRGDGWAIAPLSAHHYGVLAHFTTLERAIDELESAQLDRDVVVLESSRGARVKPGDDTRAADWFHFVARPR
jgi:SAM-dependent methyltransferase